MNTCPCCGQTIKPAAKRRTAARSFKGYDDFHPALVAAQTAACAALGEYWKLVRGASVYARVPRPWVAVKTAHANLPGHRDMRLPAARFWPAGQLPEGPEYTAEYAWDDHTAGADLRVAKILREHAGCIRYIRDMQQPAGSPPSPIMRAEVAKGLAFAAAKRAELAQARRAASMAVAA